MASYKIMGLVFVRIWEKQNQFLLIKLVDNRICREVVKMLLVYVGSMWVGVLKDFGKENHLWKLVIIQKCVWIFAIFFRPKCPDTPRPKFVNTFRPKFVEAIYIMGISGDLIRKIMHEDLIYFKILVNF